MAHNFRELTGDVYTSKDGSDANPVAADPDNPKLTLANQGVTNNVVGTGEYKGAFNLNSAGTRTYTADHFVKINPTSALLINSASTTVTSFLGGWWLFEMNGQDFTQKGGGATTCNYTRCIITGGVYNNSVPADGFHTSNYTECIIEGMTIGANGFNEAPVMQYCKLFNTTYTQDVVGFTGSEYSINNSYVDANTVFTLNAYFTTPATQFANNNYQGKINIGGTLYELKQDKDGNPIDPNPAVSDWIAIDPNVYTNGNFSQDPAFLNLTKRDYWSVSSSSPNLFADSSGLSSIGDVSVGSVITVLDTELSTGATIVNLIISTGDLVLDTPGSDGSVESSNIQAFVIAQQVARVMFATLLNMNSLQAIGSSENTNVPAVQNYAAGTAGANPRRLNYELMWTDAATAPTTDAEYTNNGYIAAGTKAVFQCFDIPRIDLSGNGNGLPAYSSASDAPILGKHFKAKITLLEGWG